MFFGFYLIRKARESYVFNDKFRWINEKRKSLENKNTPAGNIQQSKYENLNQESPIPVMTPYENSSDEKRHCK